MPPRANHAVGPRSSIRLVAQKRLRDSVCRPEKEIKLNSIMVTPANAAQV